MSIILAVLPRKRTKTQRAPKLLVECSGCGCRYVTCTGKRRVLARTTCTECRPRTFEDRAIARRAGVVGGTARWERMQERKAS